MGLIKITRTVLSYCEIPEKITLSTNIFLDIYPTDCYVEFRITPKVDQSNYSSNFDLDNWIIDTYPELEGMTILIHIDY